MFVESLPFVTNKYPESFLSLNLSSETTLRISPTSDGEMFRSVEVNLHWTAHVNGSGLL